MNDAWSFGPTLAVLANALGCGLLIGIERERRKGDGAQRAFAGIRSFSLTSLCGALAALLGTGALLTVGAACVAALSVVAYLRSRMTDDDPGITTEIALLVTYLIGAVCVHSQAVAAGLAVVVTGLLASRNALHRFARTWLWPSEVRGGLILAAVALLVVPLAPDRPLWGDVLNPQVVVRLVLVLLLIQSLAHLARRFMQARHAMALSALASGFVSSTATIATLGMEVREDRRLARSRGGAAALSCVSTMAQLLAVAATVQPAWLARLWLPALCSGAVAGIWGWLLMRGSVTDGTPTSEAAEVLSSDSPMFKLRDILMIAGLLTFMQALVRALTLWWGEAGLLAGALLAALADVHAAAAAVLVQGPPEGAVVASLEHALMAAVSVHAVSKTVVAVISGGKRYAMLAGSGIFAHTLAFVGAMAWWN